METVTAHGSRGYKKSYRQGTYIIIEGDSRSTTHIYPTFSSNIKLFSQNEDNLDMRLILKVIHIFRSDNDLNAFQERL